jgi:hypothetical protein
MVGGSVAHATIKDNITGALRARLRGTPCRAFSESLKVVTNIGSHYPDVVVSCVPMQPTDDQVREPVVAVEVLSRTTAATGAPNGSAIRRLLRSSTTCWLPGTGVGWSCSPGPARPGT